MPRACLAKAQRYGYGFLEWSDSGEIANTGDSKDLARAILAILNDPTRYRGDSLEVARRFSPDANAAAYEKVYKELLDR